MLSVTVSVITVGPLESFLNLLTFDTNEEKVEKDQNRNIDEEGKGRGVSGRQIRQEYRRNQLV